MSKLLLNIRNLCLRQPDQTALVENDRQLTYDQLNHAIASLSGSLNIKPGQRIVIALDRGIDAAISILAVLASGACYIPIDINNPPERLNFIINDANADGIIGKGQIPSWLDYHCNWIDFTQLSISGDGNFDPIHANSEDLSTILYTSGSTGAPKGVAISYRAVENFVDWMAKTFNVNPNDHIASLSPFYFDLSLFDLFTGLGTGASIYFIPNRMTMAPSQLTNWLSEQNISIWYTIPSLLTFITMKGSLSSTPLPKLKKVLFAGEIFPTKQLIKLCQMLPDVKFFNLYGPTETNVCSYWPVQRDRLDPSSTIPIGNPACSALLKIDPDSQELLVKSMNNLSGYWRNGQLETALSHDDFYRTGDKVSMNDLGEYCFHGRIDRMLKCSGYRVEPAEIEHVIQQCEAVINCAVLGIADATAGQRTAAVLELSNISALENVVKYVRRNLPNYMHPTKYLVLENLPLLSNGKIDYQKLQTELDNAT